MGGRGSAYDRKNEEDLKDIEQIQREDYLDGEEVNPMDFITDEESDIKDEMFTRLKLNNVSMRKSTDDINKSYLTELQKYTEAIAKKYDYILDETISNVQFAGEYINDSSVGGYTAPLTIMGGLELRFVLNKNLIKDIKKFEQRNIYSVETKWHSPIDYKEARYYTLVHELGHCVESCIISRIQKNSNLSDIQIATNIRNEVEKICKTKYKSDIINISKYSRQNSMEWFAETFTNLMLSSKPVSVARALNDYLEGLK